MYHLWQAYYEASVSENKDELLYARILMMMNHEHIKQSGYERFHKYIAPAFEAYERALAADQAPSDYELKSVRDYYDSLLYVLNNTENSSEQLTSAYSRIEGLNEIDDFQIHDSKPVYFEHDLNRAVLKLDYCGVCVTFEFSGLIDISINVDTACDWVNDFYCYPIWNEKKSIFFDIGYYRISCEKIRIINVTRR